MPNNSKRIVKLKVKIRNAIKYEKGALYSHCIQVVDKIICSIKDLSLIKNMNFWVRIT